MLGRIKLGHTLLACDQGNFNQKTAPSRNRTLVVGRSERGTVSLYHQDHTAWLFNFCFLTSPSANSCLLVGEIHICRFDPDLKHIMLQRQILVQDGIRARWCLSTQRVAGILFINGLCHSNVFGFPKCTLRSLTLPSRIDKKQLKFFRLFSFLDFKFDVGLSGSPNPN